MIQDHSLKLLAASVVDTSRNWAELYPFGLSILSDLALRPIAVGLIDRRRF